MVEYATMRLAHLANIHVPDFEVLEIGGLPVFLIQRFDRNRHGQRLHYISANSLVGINKISARGTEYATQYSYGGIAEIGRAISQTPIETSHELFRRMVFNILIGNIDDHLRNHGFIYSQEKKLYSLSPAFDLLPNQESGPQYIGVGAQGRASTMTNAISQCTRFYLNKDQALAIINDVYSVVANWKKVFQECGVAKKDIHVLQGSFFSHAQFIGEMNALR
jgi:serine/threonine-protein kinase HipA